jgi:hypothetical protein
VPWLCKAKGVAAEQQHQEEAPLSPSHQRQTQTMEAAQGRAQGYRGHLLYLHPLLGRLYSRPQDQAVLRAAKV